MCCRAGDVYYIWLLKNKNPIPGFKRVGIPIVLLINGCLVGD